jgi:hypothetical protein
MFPLSPVHFSSESLPFIRQCLYIFLSPLLLSIPFKIGSMKSSLTVLNILWGVLCTSYTEGGLFDHGSLCEKRVSFIAFCFDNWCQATFINLWERQRERKKKNKLDSAALRGQGNDRGQVDYSLDVIKPHPPLRHSHSAAILSDFRRRNRQLAFVFICQSNVVLLLLQSCCFFNLSN